MKPKEMAEDTLRIIDRGSYEHPDGSTVTIAPLLAHSLSGTRLFTPEELTALSAELTLRPQYDTVYEVHNETTLDAVRRLAASGDQAIMCLNFASAKNPGGGFLGGAVAQEETIARASGLYPTLLKGEEYYRYHRAQGTCLYSDHMIYSPEVPVFRYEHGGLMEAPVCVSVVTSPAVNAGILERYEPQRTEEIASAMRIRTEKVLSLSAHYGHGVLVLGAWGCGVFRNDPELIAALFRELLEGRFKGHFRKVVFAVKTKSEAMLQSFSSRFKTEAL